MGIFSLFYCYTNVTVLKSIKIKEFTNSIYKHYI